MPQGRSHRNAEEFLRLWQGAIPAISILRTWHGLTLESVVGRVKEISVFVDESGSYDADASSSPYYLVCLVLHDQSVNLSEDLRKLDEILVRSGARSNACIHATPLIRRESEYAHEVREVRKKLFFAMLSFIRRISIGYRCFRVDKRYVDDTHTLRDVLVRDLTNFLVSRTADLSVCDKIKVYYDNGQSQIKKILLDVFAVYSSKVEFVPEVTPSKYRLFQVADMICTLENIRIRLDDGVGLNNSEKLFFGNARLFRRNVLQQILPKRI